jgi:FixJ family two-component response regulator
LRKPFQGKALLEAIRRAMQPLEDRSEN